MEQRAIKCRVKEALEQRHLKVADLSRQTGIPYSRISKWFHKDIQPKVEDAQILERWLGNLPEKLEDYKAKYFALLESQSIKYDMILLELQEIKKLLQRQTL